MAATPEELDTLFSKDIEWLRKRVSKTRSVSGVEAWEFIDVFGERPHAPEFYVNDLDECYREGFEEGFDYCIYAIDAAYRKRGFVRVREIVNILWDWSERILRPWRYYGKGKLRNSECEHDHPVMTDTETWAEIRARIIRRDRKCVRCGDVGSFEVDHIKDVQDGGLPTDGNLRTLCLTCHKGKRFWDK